MDVSGHLPAIWGKDTSQPSELMLIQLYVSHFTRNCNTWHHRVNRATTELFEGFLAHVVEPVVHIRVATRKHTC